MEYSVNDFELAPDPALVVPPGCIGCSRKDCRHNGPVMCSDRAAQHRGGLNTCNSKQRDLAEKNKLAALQRIYRRNQRKNFEFVSTAIKRRGSNERTKFKIGL